MGDDKDGLETNKWTKACCLAVAVTVAGSPGMAAAFRADAVKLAAANTGLKLVTAENGLKFSVQDIEAEPGKEIPITLSLPSATELQGAGADKGVFILIRNIPEGVSVSAGMTTGRVWVVPLREASTLRLVSKPGVTDEFQLSFYLMGPNSKALAEATTTVRLRSRQDTAATLGPAMPKPDSAKPEAATVQPQTPPPPQAERLTPQAETALLSRGRDVLRQGGVAAARIIFEELATHGSAAGALALARTYDPSYVVPSGAAAPAPSLAEARKWYERAAQLGNADAKRRLAELAPGG
jgi:hypothetical protein